MLKILRRKGVMRKLLWLLAVVIILAFGFFGQAYLLNRAPKVHYAGRVFGRTVPFDEFQKHFQQIHIQAAMQYGRNLYKVLPHLNLEDQTWDRILALQAADQRNIHISDQQVIESIRTNPFFQKDGRFDNDIYKNILYAFRITPRQFEEGLRESLKIAKLYEQVTREVQVADEEILAQYKSENEKVQISYIFFPIDEYKNEIVVDEQAVQAHYNEHKNEFMQPPKINIAYLQISYPPEATLDDKDTAWAQGLDLAKELDENPDLKEAARRHNLPVEESGFFSMAEPVLKEGWSFDLVQQFFQAPLGTISDPVETSQGVQLLQLIDKQPAAIPEYEQAQEMVVEAWKEKQARHLARDKAQVYAGEIKESYLNTPTFNFVQFAKDESLKIEQTPVFHRGQYLPQIGLARDFQQTAFSLTQEQPISQAVETSKGYAILHLDSRLPIDEGEFEKKKDEITQRLLQQKSNNLFNDFISALRIEAELEDNIAKLKAQQKKQAAAQTDEENDGNGPEKF